MGDVRALAARALSLFDAGRTDEAAIAYEALLTVDPNRPNAWFNYALVLRRTRRFDDALAAYERALQLHVEGPEEAYLNRAVILSDDLACPDGAKLELQKALSVAPGYVPALLNLGNLHEDLGEWDNARAAYERVLATDPHNALALARSLGLTPALSADDPAIERVEAALMGLRPDSLSRADLGFALGKALDSLALYDRAFAAYTAANEAARAVSEALGFRYVREAQERLTERLLNAFSKPVDISGTSMNQPPVFICGMFRSGSTLAEHILARHSRVTAGGELSALPALIAHRFGSYPDMAAQATPEDVISLRNAYMKETAHRCPTGCLLIDKRPENFMHVGLIKMLWPTAKIINTVRNPLDTCLSVFFMHADPTISYANRIHDIAHYQQLQESLMAHWSDVWPDDVFHLDYDELVCHPREVVKSLVDFCDLEWEEAVLDYRHPSGAVRTASHDQVRRPLYRSSSGRWRNYAKHLEAAFPSGAPWRANGVE